MLYAVILKAEAPFKQDQTVMLHAYEQGQAAFAANLDMLNPDIIFQGVVTRPYDLPLVRFGGQERWFMRFQNRDKWVLAILWESNR